MITRKIITYLLLTIVLLLSRSVSADPPQLSHNPFSRPVSKVNSDVVATVLSSDGQTLALDLKATMVAEKVRLANVAGRLLSPGEEVQGYRLVSVYEDRAVFDRGGELLTVFVKPVNVDEE